MLKRLRKGFTLIELMIVVAIIGVLAAIAIPNFLKFQCKSKTSEAKEMLKGIYTANVAYAGETETFTDDINVFGLDLGNTGNSTSGEAKYFTFKLEGFSSTSFYAHAYPKNPLQGSWRVGYYGSGNVNNGMVKNFSTYCP